MIKTDSMKTASRPDDAPGIPLRAAAPAPCATNAPSSWGMRDTPVLQAPALTPITHARQTAAMFPFKNQPAQGGGHQAIILEKATHYSLPCYFIPPATDARLSLFFLDSWHHSGSEKSSFCCYLSKLFRTDSVSSNLAWLLNFVKKIEHL